MTNNKYINEAYKNEILLGLYFSEPLALQLYSWGWLQQQSCEDHEAYVTRLDRYAKVLCEERALVKIKLLNKGYYGLKYSAIEACRLPGSRMDHGIVLRQATEKEIWMDSRKRGFTDDGRVGIGIATPGGHFNPRDISLSTGFAHYPDNKRIRSSSEYKIFIKDHKSNFVMVYWVALNKALCHNVVDLITIGVG